MCAGPQTKDKHMTQLEALLLLAAWASNGTWVLVARQRWFTE